MIRLFLNFSGAINRPRCIICKCYCCHTARLFYYYYYYYYLPWRRGRCLAWDATCPDTFAMSHVSACSNEAGSAAATAEMKKIQKYSDIISGVDFVPMATETSGVWGRQPLDLINEIGCRIAAVTHEPRSTAFLRQRISVAVQRGNAYCVLGTLQSSRNVD